MNILPINSNPTVQNNNFRSRFIYNTAIHEIVESSDKTDLARFQNMLQSMRNIKDDLYFWVKKQVNFYELNKENIGYVVKYYLFKQNGANEKVQELVATISSSKSDFNHNKLKLITEALRGYYLKIAEENTELELKNKIYDSMA